MFLAVAALLLLAGSWWLAPHAARASGLRACGARAVTPLVYSLEGTATQVVAFVGVENHGPACGLRGVLSFAVLEGGRIARVRGNPIIHRLVRDFAHGRTVLFDVWWANWCGSPRVSRFSARVALGRARDTARYPLLPVCLSRAARSRLQVVTG